MLTAIHVCAGAGGLSLGLHRAGFGVRAFDLDRVAALVHEMHVGPCAVDNLATYHPSASADVVAGGVPCQPYSMAGGRRGMNDVHGSLFEEAHGMLFEHLVRVAAEANARAVVLENVPGLVSWRSAGAHIRVAGADAWRWALAVGDGAAGAWPHGQLRGRARRRRARVEWPAFD